MQIKVSLSGDNGFKGNGQEVTTNESLDIQSGKPCNTSCVNMDANAFQETCVLQAE